MTGERFVEAEPYLREEIPEADGKIGVCDTPAVFSNPGPHPLRGLHGIGCTTYLAARTVSLLYLRPPGRAGSPHFYEQSTDM